MLLLNYDFYDIHCALVLLRAKPEKPYNIEVIKSILDILSAPQVDNIIDNNIIRKKLRVIKNIDKEDFNWIYVDNIYTYGWKIIRDEFCYTFLSHGLLKMLDCAQREDWERFQDLADAFHEVPIFFSDDWKNLKSEIQVHFSHYNTKYKSNLWKELSK